MQLARGQDNRPRTRSSPTLTAPARCRASAGGVGAACGAGGAGGHLTNAGRTTARRGAAAVWRSHTHVRQAAALAPLAKPAALAGRWRHWRQ